MWIVTGLTMQLLASAAPIPPCGVDWVIGDVVAQPVWNSGETESLSPWKSVDCSAFGPQYTLASITVNREPKKNLDRFVARLTATCREFLPRCQAGAGDGDHEVEVFASAYRQGSSTPGATWAQWPAGCLEVHPDHSLLAGFQLVLSAGKSYVKNVALRRLDIFNNGTARIHQCGPSEVAIGDDGYGDGKFANLDCGENVLTGLSLAYDTRNGKIRKLKLECRAVAEKP